MDPCPGLPIAHQHHVRHQYPVNFQQWLDEWFWCPCASPVLGAFVFQLTSKLSQVEQER